MSKSMEELEAELEKTRNDLGAFRGRYEKADKELKETRTQLSQFEARNAMTDLPQAGAELLGEAGVATVQALAQREIARLAPGAQQNEQRLSRMEIMFAAQAGQQFTAAVNEYVATYGGETNFVARIAPGGDINPAWMAFLGTPRGAMAQAAFAACDFPTASMAIDSFMLSQRRNVRTDVPPGTESAAPRPKPMTSDEYDTAMSRFDDRIRAGESPTKVNPERQTVMMRMAGLRE